MDHMLGLDWAAFAHSLSEDELRELAAWLAAEFLEIGEFVEVVDREYAHASDAWHTQSTTFVNWRGRPVAQLYARRKRRYAELVAGVEDARMTGALPGEFAPEDLRAPGLCWTESRTVEELVGVLEHA